MDIIDLLNPKDIIDLLNPKDIIDLLNPMDIIDVQKEYDWLLFKVRRTETKDNNLNPDWSVLYMSLNELCESDFNMKLQVIGLSIRWSSIKLN